MLPSTLVHDACWTERSDSHAALARVVDDPVEAAGHQAPATEVPDELLAAEVTAATGGGVPVAGAGDGDAVPHDRTRPGPRRRPSSLTDAELRLALLVRQGASNQEAAAKLYLSLKTVEARLTRIYQKLDVRSRAQLATAVNAWPGHRPTG